MDKIFIAFLFGVISGLVTLSVIAPDPECVADHGEEIVKLRDECKKMFKYNENCYQKAVTQYCD